MSRVLVCSGIKGLTDALKKVLAPEISCREIILEETLKIQDRNVILVADNSDLGTILKSQQCHFGFIQGTWAGIDAISKSLHEIHSVHTPVCRFAHDSFSQLIAEYVIAQVIASERDFLTMHQWQAQEFYPEEKKLPRCVNQMTIGILGYGNMGKAVAKIFKAMGASVWALKRTNIETNPDSNVDKVVLMDQLDTLLENCDYICNVLPNTEKTTDCLSDGILEHCKEIQSVFVNVGRANVVSDEALLKALDNKWLSSAILDVFHEEPLPQGHPFWKHPKITITPHISALSRPEDIAECFGVNFGLFLEKKPLRNVVDWKEFY